MPESLKVQILDTSIVEYYKERSNYGSDSGYDLYCPDTIVVLPNCISTIDFKIRCSPDFEKIHGYYLCPRSSISKTPLIMANSIGIIDHSYRGNIMAKVFNTNNVPFEIKKGERLFQLCMPSLEPFNVSFVDEVDETERGSGGFGSTGK